MRAISGIPANPLPHTTHGMSVISSGMVVVVVVVGVMVRI